MRQTIGLCAMAVLLVLAALLVATSIVLMLLRGEIWLAAAVVFVLSIAALAVWGLSSDGDDR